MSNILWHNYNMTSEMFIADVTEEEWEQIRELAHHAIETGMFGTDPVKCVVNAYITWLMFDQHKRDQIDENDIH